MSLTLARLLHHYESDFTISFEFRRRDRRAGPNVATPPRPLSSDTHGDVCARCPQTDLLDIATLIQAAHVCRRWRPIAFGANLFSAAIVIHNLTPSALDFVDFRLKWGGTRRVTLLVDVTVPDRLVETRVLPLVEEALPRVHILEIWLESIYRLQLENVLSNPAPLLRVLHLKYVATPLPEVPMTLPLPTTLFAGRCDTLRSVRLFNTILPRDVIPAFSQAEEVLWVHTKWTMQAEFPCYLFDFFPKVRKLRRSGGGMEFRNAPLPVTVIERFKQLELLELQFIEEYIPGFFGHLPMHSLPQLLISDAEEDGVYAALDPLRSPFHLSIYATSGAEFVITGEGQKSKLVRHLLEAHKYYKPWSQLTNALLENEEFAAQLATLKIHTSLWSMLHPWLPSFVSLPKLIVEIDEYTFKSVTLPLEALPCPALQTLVLQAKHDFVYIAAEEVLAFVDRITLQAARLELCRVFVDGSLDLLAGRFSPVVRTQDRIGPSKHPIMTC